MHELLTLRPQSGRGEPLVRLGVVGDLALSGGVPQDGLLEVAPILQSLDGCIANYEGTLSSQPQLFQAGPETAESIAMAGVSIVSLANNHTYDYGPGTLARTARLFENAGVKVVGMTTDSSEAEPRVEVIRGLTIGFLAATRSPVDRTADLPKPIRLSTGFLQAVERAAAQVDHLIISIHSGLMYLEYPTEEDVGLATQLAHLGTRAVLFQHSHVPQGFDVIKNCFVHYGLGNFLMDPEEGVLDISIVPDLQRRSSLVVLDLGTAPTPGVQLLPCTIGDDLRLRPSSASEARRAHDRMLSVSKHLHGSRLVRFVIQRIARNTPLLFAEGHGYVKRGEFRSLAARVFNALLRR